MNVHTTKSHYELEFALEGTTHSNDNLWKLTKNSGDPYWTLWQGNVEFDDMIVDDHGYQFIVDSLNSIPILRTEVKRLREER